MSEKNYSIIQLVIDRSGSMGVLKEEAQGATNRFIDDQREVDGRCDLRITQFDDVVEVAQEIIDIQNYKKYTLEPRGMTSLLDAIGLSINALEEIIQGKTEDKRPETVVVVITTDGLENNSKEYTKDKINEMIKDKTDNQKWQFVFLAANQDAMATGSGMGMKTNSSMSYSAQTPGSYAASSAIASAGVSTYRSSAGGQSVTFTEEQREEAMRGEKK